MPHHMCLLYSVIDSRTEIKKQKPELARPLFAFSFPIDTYAAQRSPPGASSASWFPPVFMVLLPSAVHLVSVVVAAALQWFSCPSDANPDVPSPFYATLRVDVTESVSSLTRCVRFDGRKKRGEGDSGGGGFEWGRISRIRPAK